MPSGETHADASWSDLGVAPPSTAADSGSVSVWTHVLTSGPRTIQDCRNVARRMSPLLITPGAASEHAAARGYACAQG
jgi:hypothetical protein